MCGCGRRSPMHSIVQPMIEYLWRGRRNRPQHSAAAELGVQRQMFRPTITIPKRRSKCSTPPDTRQSNGVRFHITMKTSTDANTRLMVAVMQQQLREVGIALDIRSFEFATFFSDVSKERFRCTRCAGSAATKIPTFSNMRSTRRSFRRMAPIATIYSNPKVDALIDKARREIDPQGAQAILCRGAAHPGGGFALHQSVVSR